MVLAVVALVFVLVFVASGYWVSGDLMKGELKVSRSGLLKIDSFPTGATLTVDDEKWSQKTNMSKVVSSEEHRIVISKEGYDTWEKTVNVSEGLLYYLRYPRLFLNERLKESVLDVSEISYISASPESNMMLVVDKNNKWSILDLTNETYAKKSIDINKLFGADAESKITILNTEWSNRKKALVSVLINEQKDWFLIDCGNPDDSVNLSEISDVDFGNATIVDDGKKIIVLDNKILSEVDVAKKKVTPILEEKIDDYYYNENGDIAFVLSEDDKTSIKLLRSAEKSDLLEFEEKVRIVANRFYDDYYLVVFRPNMINVYKGIELTPIYEESSFSISLDDLRIKSEDGFIAATDGNRIISLDMEAMKATSWDVNAERFGWLEKYMIYEINDGQLSVYDFDGENKRQLLDGVSKDFPAMIANNKWLYYVSDGSLMREWLVKK